jgi:hypothetical protein
MDRYRVNRRTVLRGLLGGTAVSVGLPILDWFVDGPGAAYAGDGFPKRFGLFYWGNGNNPDRWTPTGEGEDWSLSEQLAPLASIKDVITVVSGLAVKLPNISPHHSGAAGILSGGPVLDDLENFALPTIDQVIAQAIGGDSLFKSLEFGANPGDGMSYNGPYSINPPETSPYALYERLFGANFREPGEGGLIDPTLGLRRSVLDAVVEDANRMRSRVGTNDQQRLDQHLTGIRELEQRLARLEEDPPNLEACLRADAPAPEYPDVEGRPPLLDINEAFCDLIALSLACDQTRVFSNFYTHALTNVLFPGAPDGHHNLTHDEGDDQPNCHEIVLNCMSAFNTLVEKLRAIPEGDGTLLDNCAILCTSDVSKGQTHLLSEMPVIIAGSACGRLRTDYHYRSPTAENASKLLVTLARAMDVPVAELGMGAGLVTDGLSDIDI